MLIGEGRFFAIYFGVFDPIAKWVLTGVSVGSIFVGIARTTHGSR